MFFTALAMRPSRRSTARDIGRTTESKRCRALLRLGAPESAMGLSPMALTHSSKMLVRSGEFLIRCVMLCLSVTIVFTMLSITSSAVQGRKRSLRAAWVLSLTVRSVRGASCERKPPWLPSSHPVNVIIRAASASQICQIDWMWSKSRESK